MKATTNITKLDLIKFNLSVVPRMRSTYIAILIIATVTFLLTILVSGSPQTAIKLAIYLTTSATSGILGVLFGFAINATSLLLMSSTKNGVLGEHCYTLSPEGLHEKTASNEGPNSWHGIVSVKVIGPCLLIQIASCLFHVIPKRNFDSPEHFESFANLAKAYWQKENNITLK